MRHKIFIHAMKFYILKKNCIENVPTLQEICGFAVYWVEIPELLEITLCRLLNM